jgi:hypothetical protein
MKLSDKKIIWGLSIVAVLLLIGTFFRQYSESKIGEYKNEVAILQNNLNAELGRLLYYMITANQHENLSLLVTINKNIDVNSIISPNVNPTSNREIDLVEQKKNDLKRQLKEKQITPASYYNERLKIDCSLYEEHFNIYNKLNGDLNNKLKHGSIWSFWNSFFILVEFVCILINVLGQSYLIITIYKKNKAGDVLSENS